MRSTRDYIILCGVIHMVHMSILHPDTLGEREIRESRAVANDTIVGLLLIRRDDQ